MVTSNELKAVLIQNLHLEDMGVEELSDDTALFGEDGLGLDSVDSIELVLMLEREYGIKLQNSKEYEKIFTSIKTLLNFINEQKPSLHK